MTLKVSDTIQHITDQRQALESLIRIAQSVHNQQSALSELALAARPSQDFPPKVLQYFAAVEKRLGDIPVPDILKKIETIEAITEQDLSKIVYLATLDVNQLRANQIQSPQLENIDVAYFADAIANFKRRTQTALAMRVMLKKRGVGIQPFNIPISQEKLGREIQALKEKEVKCVTQIKQEIKLIISDTKSLLNQQSLSEEIRKNLTEVIVGMRVNLKHLNAGGLVTNIPNKFEIVTLESAPTNDITETKETESNYQATEQTEKEKQPAQASISEPATQESSKNYSRSYWWIFKRWILSPWKTTWRSLVKKHRA